MIACFLCFMFAFLVRQELQRQEREQSLPQDFTYDSDQTHCHLDTARQLAEYRSHLNINAGAESFANVDNGAATGLDAPPPPVLKKNAFLRNPLFRDSKVCPHQNLNLKYRRKCSNVDGFTMLSLISNQTLIPASVHTYTCTLGRVPEPEAADFVASGQVET